MLVLISMFYCGRIPEFCTVDCYDVIAIPSLVTIGKLTLIRIDNLEAQLYYSITNYRLNFITKIIEKMNNHI